MDKRQIRKFKQWQGHIQMLEKNYVESFLLAAKKQGSVEDKILALESTQSHFREDIDTIKSQLQMKDK